jgi:hypothetical protein
MFSPLRPLIFITTLAATVWLTGCASTPPYRYRYIPGKTAILRNGIAIAPERAPRAVKAAIQAGNEIAGMPYRYGGGHRSFYDSGYDCSGSVSYVLRAAGRLRSPMTSNQFRRYGAGGHGKWISIYARRDHVFLVVAGLRFDTGWGDGSRGPQWTTASRPAKKCVIRHPVGL